jgi:hypothetical protein
LIVGAYGADPSSKSNTGKSYVIFGKTDTNAIDLTKLNSDSKYARSNAAMLPALMIMVSLPAPALRTSIPP